MAEERKSRSKKEKWGIRGFDTFEEEFYPLDGEFLSEERAKEAARLRLKELEKTQPTKLTGGQNGIQDRVYIIRPDGSQYRFFG